MLTREQLQAVLYHQISRLPIPVTSNDLAKTLKETIMFLGLNNRVVIELDSNNADTNKLVVSVLEAEENLDQ